jgi:hypothetical protein
LASEAYRYSDELATFVFVTEPFSSHCCSFLRMLLDLPSQQALNARFGSHVAEMDRVLTDVNAIPARVKQFVAKYPTFSGQLRCTVCIDAFTIEPTRPRQYGWCTETWPIPGPEADTGLDNAYFSVQLTPWNRQLRVAMLHIFAAENG